MPKLKNETQTAEAVGRKLRRMRKESKRTMAQTARMLDISVVAYSKMERGKSVFTLPRLEQLALAFGTTLGGLLDLPPVKRQRTREELEDELREKDMLISVLQSVNDRMLQMLANGRSEEKNGKQKNRH